MKYYEGQTVFSLILHDLVTIVKFYYSLDYGYILTVKTNKGHILTHTEKDINIVEFFNGNWWSTGRGDEV